MTNYGKQVTFDIQLSPNAHMQNVTDPTLLLQNIVKNIEMLPIGNVHVDYYHGNKDWDGASATLHVQTSHVTTHIFEKFNYLFLDVFSCKDFDEYKVLSTISETVGGDGSIESVNMKEVVRGLNFPKDHL